MLAFLVGTCLISFITGLESMEPQAPAAAGKRLAPEDVARLPLPGTTVPTLVGFSPDGASVSYLLPTKPGDNTRVLWRGPSDGKTPPKVVGRPSGEGENDANVSKEEALRRERQRNRDVGITSLHRASRADLTVMPIAGDLFLQSGDGPVTRLTETPAPEIDPRLSPDGSHVAYVRDNELHVMRLSDRTETRLTKGATEGLTHGLAEFMAQEEMGRFTGFWWSPDGSRIAYQETDERHIPLFTIVHEGTPEFSAETHRYPFPGKENARVGLFVVDVKGGEPRRLTLVEPGTDFYLARVDWQGNDAVLVQVLNRAQTSLRLERIEVASDKRSLILEETAPTWINLHDDLRVLPTGEILWSSERTGFRHLEIMKGDGTGRRAITSGEWAVDGVSALDPVRREVWFTSGKEDVTGALGYRVGIDDGKITPVATEPGTHKLFVAPGGDRFVDLYSSIEKPSTATLRDRDGKILATLDDSARDPRLVGLELAPPEMLSFRSRDGVELRGAFYAPLGVPAGTKAPLIVLLYGGPHVQYVPNAWTLTADLRARYFASNGFAVWKMDNRGAARRGHAFEAALHRRMGVVEVRDQVDGVKFITGRKADLVDAARVGVNGRSYGGYMALRCLIEAPDVFHAAVSEAPVTDWDGYDTCYTERYMGTPANNAEGYKIASVTANVARLSGKLLVMHGLIDENVHFRHTARLVSALIEAGKPFEILPVPEERHSSRKHANRVREFETLAAFFRRSLGRP